MRVLFAGGRGGAEREMALDRRPLDAARLCYKKEKSPSHYGQGEKGNWEGSFTDEVMRSLSWLFSKLQASEGSACFNCKRMLHKQK